MGAGMEKEGISWADLIPCVEQDQILPVGLTIEEGRGAFVPVRLARPWLRMRNAQPASVPLETLKKLPYFNDQRTSKEIVLEVFPLSGLQWQTVIYMNHTAFAYFSDWLQSPLGQRYKNAVEGGTGEIPEEDPDLLSNAFLQALLAEMEKPHRPRGAARVEEQKDLPDPANTDRLPDRTP